MKKRETKAAPRVGYYPRNPAEHPAEEYYGNGENDEYAGYDGSDEDFFSQQDYPAEYEEETPYGYDNGTEQYDLPEEEDYADYPDEIEVQQSEEEKKAGWKALASVGDFAAVILGGAAIFLSIAVLAALFSWVHLDLMQSFGGILGM